LKTGKLEPEEWILMKQHTAMGEQILEGSSNLYLQTGRIIAKTHHEKWDGSGYPLGLENKKIPIEGRITAVADVFDALTTKRPYKKAITSDEAFQILLEGRGSHFDPNLVDAFLSIKEEILGIKNNYEKCEVERVNLCRVF
jgi:putative two-component system response regulator